MEWWLGAIMAGAPTTRMFTVVSPTSHRRQWNRASFKISGEERPFLPQLAGDLKSKVSDSAPCYLYHNEKTKKSFRTHARDSVWCARCLVLFTIQAMECPTHYKWGLCPHVNNIDPPGMAGQQGRRSIMPMTSKGVRGFCS
jgi:hypothetical protein